MLISSLPARQPVSDSAVRARRLLGDVAVLVIAALGSLAPTPWISFPAASLLVLWLPGRLVVRALPPLDAGPGQIWLALTAGLVLVPVPLSWFWRYSMPRPGHPLLETGRYFCGGMPQVRGGDRVFQGRYPAALRLVRPYVL